MKKLICSLLILSLMIPWILTPASAAEFIPEEYTTEQLLAMDETLDSDNDGVADVYELLFGSNRFSPDTDNDGVTDYVELFVTATAVNDADGDLDTDNDGLTNAEECMYGTDADDKDSDNDNLSDYDEIKAHGTNPLQKDTDTDGLHDAVELELDLDPLLSMTDGVTLDSETEIAEDYFLALEAATLGNPDYTPPTPVASPFVITDPNPGVIDGPTTLSTYGGILYTNYGSSVNSSNISYRFGDRLFFYGNTTYNKDLAATSAILSTIAYGDNYITINSGGSLSTTASNAVERWMNFHGFTYFDDTEVSDPDLKCTLYSSLEGDCHVSKMFLGHKQVTYNGVTKQVVCVVIRGTFGIDEWQSNFDIGTTSESPRNPDWSDITNHKGFDIAATRLNEVLDKYIEYKNIGDNYVLWITGHSRGGAIANVLADKRITAGDTLYCYTFASPATTVYGGAQMSKYNCIHNVLNEDDFVTKLPFWGFRRYGQDIVGHSVEDDYASAWDDMMINNISYTSSTNLMATVLEYLPSISTTRNGCYEYNTNVGGFCTSEGYGLASAAEDAAQALCDSYPANTANTYRWVLMGSSGNYGYAVYQKPAFLMQLLAAVRGGTLDNITFGILDVAPYLQSAKWSVAQLSLSGGLEHPHYCESYYLIAKNIE